MHVITKKRIVEIKFQYPDCAAALDGWYRVISKNKYHNFAELKKTFGSIDKVGNLYVFDIGGNKLRLIAAIHFDRQRIYIRCILTHREYSKGKWRR